MVLSLNKIMLHLSSSYRIIFDEKCMPNSLANISLLIFVLLCLYNSDAIVNYK